MSVWLEKDRVQKGVESFTVEVVNEFGFRRRNEGKKRRGDVG